MLPREVADVAITRAEDAEPFAQDIAQRAGCRLEPRDWVIWTADAEGYAGYMILRDGMIHGSERSALEMAFTGALSQIEPPIPRRFPALWQRLRGRSRPG